MNYQRVGAIGIKIAIMLVGLMVPARVLAWDSVMLEMHSGERESEWRDALAKAWDGQTEVRIEGGRIDVMTGEAAIELDWPHKWHEGLGQALHYSDSTGKQGILALIAYGQGPEKLQTNSILHFDMVEKTCNRHGIRLVVLFPCKAEKFKHTKVKKKISRAGNLTPAALSAPAGA